MKAEEWTNLVLFFCYAIKTGNLEFFVVYHLKTFSTKRKNFPETFTLRNR